MRYIYLVTHDADYEGYDVVAVRTSKRMAIECAENNLGGDVTRVVKYPDYWRGKTTPMSFTIAKWRRKGYGAMREFKRTI